MIARALLLLAVAISGCASGPKFSEVRSSIPELDPERGRIFLYRPSAFQGAWQPSILVDGSIVGEMVPLGFFWIDRYPGTYLITARTESEATLQVELQANETRYVRCSMSLGFLAGRPNFSLVDQIGALDEMRDLGYSGTAPLGARTARAAPPPTTEETNTQLKDLEGLLPGKADEK